VSELLFEPATEAARLVAAGQVSSRELTESVLDHIAAVNPGLNAVTEVAAEAALAAADGADRRRAAGEALGPLHGVPITIKDAFDVAGLHTTWGNPAFAGHVAARDATVVARLKRAGAVVVGKTNVAFMLGDFGQTANELHGVTGNPWDPARSPGGSSGGAAAAVAAGAGFLDYGSDLAGSVRIPAAFCGVYGLKPTAGIVPLTGFQPPGPPAVPSGATWLSAVGPLARSAEDLETALAVTAGPEGPAATVLRWSPAPARHDDLAAHRVGLVLDDPACPVSSEVGAVLSDTADALAKAGVTIVEGWPDGVDPADAAEAFGFQVELFFAMQEGEELPGIVAQETARRRVRAAWDAWLAPGGRADVLLTPVAFSPAMAHDTRPFEQRTIGERRYEELPFWIAQASLPGLPAVAAPAGNTPGGLPVGVQVVGPRYEDTTAIRFAGLLGEVHGGYRRPPI
jgi:amidase